jgi:hypothetical protein
MEAIKAELEQECADKDKEIAELKAETNTKDTEIAELKVTCDEREQIIVRLDAGLKAHIAAAGMGATPAVREAEREADAQSWTMLAKLPSDADDLGPDGPPQGRPHRQHREHREGREEEIQDPALSRSPTTRRLRGTEQAKHYGRLLAEKEAMIQELHGAASSARRSSTSSLPESTAGDGEAPQAVDRALGRLQAEREPARSPAGPSGRWSRTTGCRSASCGQYEPRPIAGTAASRRPRSPTRPFPRSAS